MKVLCSLTNSWRLLNPSVRYIIIGRIRAFWKRKDHGLILYSYMLNGTLYMFSIKKKTLLIAGECELNTYETTLIAGKAHDCYCLQEYVRKMIERF